MSTFLLIPGAGSDPRVYEATIAALGELGHEGIAPPLPLTDEATPSDHAEVVVEAAPAGTAASEIVVVGHSLGAFAATIAAARIDPAKLILLAPMVPAPGESAGEWGDNTGQAEAIADLTERFGPAEEWGEEALAHVFFHDVEPAVRRANEKYDGAPAAGLFGEPLPLERWPEVPTRVLVPTEDRLFPLEFQRRVARERLGIEVDEIPGGHLPMLSRPRDLARALVELA